MDIEKNKSVAVIVAHPDDETIWAGGTILSHPSWNCFIITLCRASDSDRAPKFFKTLKVLGAQGEMGGLDDGPEQKPLYKNEVEEAILQLLPQTHFDIIISHNPTGEYTRHIRHEEISSAVISLWYERKISANELWTLAYEDGNKQYLPQPVKNATIYTLLPEIIWQKKYKIVTEIYGFETTSWEARSTTRAESFWQFKNPADAQAWLNNGGVLL